MGMSFSGTEGVRLGVFASAPRYGIRHQSGHATPMNEPIHESPKGHT